MSALLEVADLRISLPGPYGMISIVEGVDFEVRTGQIFGLAGESGCGKTITALSLLGLLPANARTAGRAVLAGRDLLTMRASLLRHVRGSNVDLALQVSMYNIHRLYRL